MSGQQPHFGLGGFQFRQLDTIRKLLEPPYLHTNSKQRCRRILISQKERDIPPRRAVMLCIRSQGKPRQERLEILARELETTPLLHIESTLGEHLNNRTKLQIFGNHRTLQSMEIHLRSRCPCTSCSLLEYFC